MRVVEKRAAPAKHRVRRAATSLGSSGRVADQVRPSLNCLRGSQFWECRDQPALWAGFVLVGDWR